METENPDDGGIHKPRRIETWITAALILIGLIIALALAIGEGMIHRNRKPPAAAPSPVIAPPMPMEPPALAALEKYFEAPDTASKSLLVRDSARVRPLMEDYHDRRSHPYQTLGRVSPGRVTELQNAPAVLFQVEPFSGPRYPVAMVWDGERFAVDWESLTAYGTIDWSEFIERRPTVPQTLRVFVSKIADKRKIPGLPAANGQFQIEHRDDPQPIVVTADAETTARLTPLTEGLRTPATLEMLWKPIGPGDSPVPHIQRLVAPQWSP